MQVCVAAAASSHLGRASGIDGNW